MFLQTMKMKKNFSLKVTSGGSRSGNGASFSGEEGRAAPYISKAPISSIRLI